MNPVSKFTPKIRREKTTLSNPDLHKDAVQVYCRLRPPKNPLQPRCALLSAPDTLVLTTPAESRGIRKEVHGKFKHIFTENVSQDEVFREVAYPLLDDLLKGKNGLLFTYGVTGSGKTFTLTGERNNPGVMPRSIYTIFNSIKNYQAKKFFVKPDRMNGFEIQSQEEIKRDQMQELKMHTMTPQKPSNKNNIYSDEGSKLIEINQGNLYSVFVSYIEVYNNSVYDLLDESSGKTLQSKILREDCNRNMYVNGVVEVEVTNAEEAFEYFNRGQRRKRMGNTLLNSISSRSHSIFNIRVVQVQKQSHSIPEANYIMVSQLSLVDLAGSERTNRTQNTGQLLREASQINNSLMSLRNCLEILKDNQINGTNKLVPYRDSRLTLLFKNYFEGDGKVVMMLCVNPSVEDFEENLQVMKFAEYTQDIKIQRTEAKYTPAKHTPFKKTIKKKTTPAFKVKPTASFTFGPALPSIKLCFGKPEELVSGIAKLTAALKARTKKMQVFNQELESSEEHFRKRLTDINNDFTIKLSEIVSLQNHLTKERTKTANLESKLGEMEMINIGLTTKNEELQDLIRQHQKIISEKDMKLNRNVLERERSKQKMALQSEKMTHELDAKLRRQREHMDAALKAKNKKIDKVREILDSEITPPSVEPEREVGVVEEKKSEILHDYNPQHTPRQPRRNVVVSSSSRHRRSRSAGEIWLEHNAVKPVPLGTVLQPTMKKRKSVTKLSKASDVTNPKQSKYCLIAQEQATDGELETKLYKGDILPTCGGGAQVVFNDVELLRQESPTK